MSTKWTLYRVFRAASEASSPLRESTPNRQRHTMDAGGHGIMSTKWTLYRVFRAASEASSPLRVSTHMKLQKFRRHTYGLQRSSGIDRAFY